MRDQRVAWVDTLSMMIDEYAGDTPRHQTGRWQWILQDPRFVFENEVVEDHPHRVRRDGVYERLISTSYIAKLVDAEKERLRQRTNEILKDAGLGDSPEVILPYVSRLYLLKKR